MATHSSVLAWRIPGMGEPGGPPSMGSHGVGHDRINLGEYILCTQIMPQMKLDALKLSPLISDYCPYFTDEKTELQQCSVTCSVHPSNKDTGLVQTQI